MTGKRILFNTSIGPGFDVKALKEWLKDENHYYDLISSNVLRDDELLKLIQYVLIRDVF